jgi:hypothetical protein
MQSGEIQKLPWHWPFQLSVSEDFPLQMLNGEKLLIWGMDLKHYIRGMLKDGNIYLMSLRTQLHVGFYNAFCFVL